MKLFGLRWEPRRLASVLLATAGAAAVVYGGSSSSPSGDADASTAQTSAGPVVGDVLTLIASVVYGVYQVLYKIYAALPTDPSEFDTVSTDPPAYEPITSEEEESGLRHYDEPSE